jgi:hypothetical protein
MLELLESPVLWVAPALLLLLVYFSSMGGLSGKKKRDRIARVNRKSRPMLQLGTQSLRRLKPGEDTAFGQVLASMQSIAKLRARLEVAGLTETTPQKFLQIMAGIALGVSGLLLLAGKSVLVSLLVGVLFGLGIPQSGCRIFRSGR